MRSALWMFAPCIAISGCGAPVTELELEIVVRADRVWLHAYEVERPFDCNQKVWLEPGGCDTVTDAYSCETEPPASCITSMHVEEDGVFVGEGFYDAGFQDGSVEVLEAPTRNLELIVEGCGGTARIPIPPVPLPSAVIEDVVDDGTTLAVTWSGDDRAASARVSWGHGFGGHRCHVAAAETTVELESPGIPPPEYLVVGVGAFTEPIEIETGLGVARVRSSAGDSQEL